ncbi:MAG: hypothetical protein LAP40_07945 [Acidobacteriia bacterium]|nr:hypothetical protein [Terriglobia bacterium]
MPFCSNCGAEVDGRFCAKCGRPVEAATPAAGPVAAKPLPAGAAPMADNLAGALCYVLLLITGILFLVLAPYNQNRAVRFHAFQAILLNIAWMVVWFGLSITLGIVHMAGMVFGLFLSPLLTLAFLALWIYMIVTTYQGKTVVLPVIGPLAQQQA